MVAAVLGSLIKGRCARSRVSTDADARYKDYVSVRRAFRGLDREMRGATGLFVHGMQLMLWIRKYMRKDFSANPQTVVVHRSRMSSYG